MRVEAKQVISPNKPNKSATKRVLELGMILSKARRGKLRQKEVARRDPRSLRGCGRNGSRTGVASCPGVGGARPSGPRSIWGCRPLVAADSAASRAVPRPARAAPCPRAGALSCSAPPPPGTGRRADRVPVSVPRAAPHPSEAPRFFRSGTTAPPRRSGRRRLPRGAGGPGPARKPGPRTAAATAAAAPRGGPLAGSSGALAGARAGREGGAGGDGPCDHRGHARGFRFRFCLLGPARLERAEPSPPPPTFWALLPGTSGSRFTRDPSALGLSKLARIPPRNAVKGGGGERKVVLRGRKQAASLSAASRCPHCP